MRMRGQAEATLGLAWNTFQEAWNYLPQTTCRSCPYLFQNELNLLLGLDFSTWFNFVKTTRILRQRE